MFRRTLAVLLAFLLIFSLSVSLVFAVELDGEGTDTGEEESVEFIITPDSPFYYLKRFMEDAKLLLTFDEEENAAYLAELVEEKRRPSQLCAW